jgi:hypothetical protein
MTSRRSGPADFSMKRDSLVSSPPRRSSRSIGARSAISAQARAKLRAAKMRSASQCEIGAPPMVGPCGSRSSQGPDEESTLSARASAGISFKVLSDTSHSVLPSRVTRLASSGT